MKQNSLYQQILNDRTKRSHLISEAVREHRSTIIEVTLNIPGPIKSSRTYKAVHLQAVSQVMRLTDAHLVYLENQHAGPFALLRTDRSAATVKQRSIDFERSTEIGRLYDIDVFNAKGEKLSRDSGLRSCLICRKPAVICAREQHHSLSELTDHIQILITRSTHIEEIRICEQFLSSLTAKNLPSAIYAVPTFERGLPGIIGRVAQAALIAEVLITPKPGLVDRISNGAHQDMDLQTFVRSTSALGDTFAALTKAAMDFSQEKPIKELFPLLKRIGIEGEKKMFSATSGINTHKGLLFSIGLICGATGYRHTHVTDLELSGIIRQMCTGLVSRELDTDQDKVATYGQTLYEREGITGARGEAEAGFPAVFQAAEHLKDRMTLKGSPFSNNLNASALQVLMENMVNFEDTNIAGRCGLDMLRYAQDRAMSYLREGGVASDWKMEILRDMDRDFSKMNISPGGSADTLAGALFIYDLDRLNL